MTRTEIDTVRTNSVLMENIAEKITMLEHIISLRGETFSRKKELADLKATYALIDSDNARNELKAIISQTKLTPLQKTVFFEYYINGKTAKRIGAECCLCERVIYSHLSLARKSLGISGKCRTNNL